MEKVEICCLKGIGEQPKHTKIIALDNKSEVVIGRSLDATVCIPSDMISRKHAILTKSGKTWAIRDNKSLNGVYINGTKLGKETEHILCDGDKIQIGVAMKPGQPAPFVWLFKAKLKVKKLRKPAPDEENASDIYQISSQRSVSDGNDQEIKSGVEKPGDFARKRQFAEPETNAPSVSGISNASHKKRKLDVEEISGSDEEKKHKQLKLKEEEDKLRALQEQQEKIQEQLREMQAQKEKMAKQMTEELKAKEQKMKEELRKREEEMKKHENELQEKLKVGFEKAFKEREKKLYDQLSEEKKRLLEEKASVERSLQEEMERKLEEKDKNLEERLKQEKDNLERIIDQKETEQQFLISELDEFKEDIEKQKDDVQKAKQAILTDFADLMESELQCSICSELFIKATSLNCSHSFCALCIEQWMDVKKQCPVCRTPITSHLHSLVLDSYIERMVELLADDMKERRKKMIEERKEEMEKREKEKQATSEASTSRGRGRGSRGGRGGRGGRGRGRGARGGNTRRAIRAMQRPVIVSDDSSSDDSSNDDNSNNNNPEFSNSEDNLQVGAEVEIVADELFSPDVQIVSDYVTIEDSYRNISSDSDSSIEGATGAVYYGGYGSCFSCGRRGHWANDCPLDY